ncbi:hypothetical protein OV203_10980 [Nannocystis sp. ILAH1]|uniref:hypothetical protein n=1 Tax=Nannocystis sp. ILAH1 TaxID=2996789 RepID=UPI00226F5120|nr:hypothetical protein [Nannocystis sp. ILAH1]MCY0987650.1 hypothetical protein [Nannocystis sp. ILAH1]
MTMTTSWPERFRNLSLSPSQRLDPEDLAVDDEAVYFTSGDAVYRVDKRTAEITELDKVPNYYAIQLAVDERHVYWVSRGVPPWFKAGRSSNECDLRRVPREGGAAEVVVREQRGIQTLALVGDAIYWVNEESPYDVWDCRVMTCPKRGGAAQELASGLLFPEGCGQYLALLGDRIFASIVPGRALWPGDGWAIATIPRAGGAADVAMVGVDADSGLASDDEYVYFVDGRSNNLLRLSAEGEASQLVIDPPGGGGGRSTATWEEVFACPDEAPYLSAPRHGFGRLEELIIHGKSLYIMAERPLDPGRSSVQAVLRVPSEGGVFEELAAWPSRKIGSIKAVCDGKHIYCDVKPEGDDYFLGRIPT